MKETSYFNILECGNHILNKLNAMCELACMATPRDKYHMEFFRTITYCNDSNYAPLSNDSIQYEIHKVIAEEESDAHNVTVGTDLDK